MKDGEVFLEIILHFLKKHKKDELFINEFREAESFEVVEKYDLIIKILKIISEDDEFYDYFSCEKIVIFNISAFLSLINYFL